MYLVTSQDRARATVGSSHASHPASSVATVLFVLCAVRACWSQSPQQLQPRGAAIPRGDSRVFDVSGAPLQAQSLLKDVALASIPLEYEDNSEWDKRKDVWDGLHMQMKGVRLYTKRRWKEVNQGTWKKYKLTMVDPEKNLKAEIVNLRDLGAGRVAFDLMLAAKVDAYARLQEWQRDIRLLSISAEATADVQLYVALEMTTALDTSQLPPDVILKPIAKRADLRLVQFKLHRVSKADGPIIRELGDGLEDILRMRLAKGREQLTGKINRAIQKNEAKLRLSLTDLVTNKWLKLDADADRRASSERSDENAYNQPD